jgi:hypothetical protein
MTLRFCDSSFHPHSAAAISCVSPLTHMRHPCSTPPSQLFPLFQSAPVFQVVGSDSVSARAPTDVVGKTHSAQRVAAQWTRTLGKFFPYRIGKVSLSDRKKWVQISQQRRRNKVKV